MKVSDGKEKGDAAAVVVVVVVVVDVDAATLH